MKPGTYLGIENGRPTHIYTVGVVPDDKMLIHVRRDNNVWYAHPQEKNGFTNTRDLDAVWDAYGDTLITLTELVALLYGVHNVTQNPKMGRDVQVRGNE